MGLAIGIFIVALIIGGAIVAIADSLITLWNIIHPDPEEPDADDLLFVG